MGLVWNACKDPGGTNGVLSVVKEQRKLGLETVLIGNGKAVELLPQLGEQFLTYYRLNGIPQIATLAGVEKLYPVVEMLYNLGYNAELRTERGDKLNFVFDFDGDDPSSVQIPKSPDVFVTSMCFRGGIGRNLVPVMRQRGVPVVAVQDFWGANIKPEWENPKFRPDFICVNDEVGADIVQRAWPEFRRRRIQMTGFPAMDKYASYNVDETSKKVREILGIPYDSPVVVYCDQIDYAGEVLAELVQALNVLGRKDLYFIPRMHPRLPNNNPKGFAEFKEALKLFRGGILIEDSSKCPTSEVIAAATVILSMYSTVNIEASCIRKQNISMLYPDFGMALFMNGAKGLMDDFPLVSLGCSTKVTDRKQLVLALAKSLGHELGLSVAQERAFKLDGKNAQRVAEFVSSLC